METKILPGWFSEAMEQVLQEKDPQNMVKWYHEHVRIEHLFWALQAQVNKLQRWQFAGDMGKVRRHAIHIANFAMMIADKTIREEARKPPYPVYSPEGRGENMENNHDTDQTEIP